MPKSNKRALVLPGESDNQKIVSAAKSDPDAQPLSAKQLKSMVSLRKQASKPPRTSNAG
jgi:hypothetical protein